MFSILPPRTMLMALTGVAVATLSTGCGEPEKPGQEDVAEAATPHSTATPRSTPNPRAAPTPKERTMIEIRIGNQHFRATLEESAAARDLLAQLPLTIDMTDHGGVEKTGPLPSPLSLDGQPDGADPDVGDVGYYAPGNDLVLYYGDQSYYPGIVILGQLEGDAAQRISDLDGPVTATVEAHGA